MFWKSILDRFPSVPPMGASLTILTGQPLAINTATGYVALADDNGTANQARPCVGLAEYGKVSTTAGLSYVGIVTKGILDITSVGLTLSTGSRLYLSNAVGTITNDASAATTTLQCVGYMISANEAYIDINHNYGTGASLTTDSVITDYILASNVTEPKLSAKAKVQKFVSDVWDFDASGAANVDALLFNSGSTPIEITKVRLMYTIASANDDGVAATSFKIGTAAFGGEEVVAAAGGLVVKNKAIGTYTDLTIVEGTVAANTTLFCRMAGVAATLAGAARIIIEYNTLEA